MLVLVGAQTLLSAAFLVGVAAAPEGRPVSAPVNLDAEANIPTWWSSVLLLGVSVSALAIWASSKRTEDPGRSRWHWLVVGGGFLAMSMDESAVLHERIGGWVGDHIDAVRDSGFFIWPVVFLPAMIVVGWAIVRTARDLDRPLASLALSGLPLLALAVIAEELSGGGAELRSPVETLIEENLEYAAIGLVLVAYSARAFATLTVSIVRPAQDATQRLPASSVGPETVGTVGTRRS